MANNQKWPISRRTVLRGAGALVALPFLEAMMPRRLMADSTLKTPKRFIVCYVPNGVLMERWTPGQGSFSGELPPTLQPLAGLKNNIMVVSNLSHVPVVADKWDGNGSAHAFSASSFLTGSTLNTVNGAELSAGVSVDQVIAARLQRAARVPSLELGCDPANLSQPCISFSPVYAQTISWKSATSPNPKEIDPRQAFKRLFSVTGRQRLERQSILDTVKDSAKELTNRAGLGVRDRQRLEEYLESVRGIEKSLDGINESMARFQNLDQEFSAVSGDYQQQLALTFKLMTLALKTNTTRVITFMMAQEISTRTYEFLGVPDDHHDLSHFRSSKGDAYIKDALGKINFYHVKMFADFLQQLKNEPDGDSNLLDTSLLLYGGGMSDGNAHGLKNLPVLLAGGTASPGIPWGTHLAAAAGSNMAQLHLAILRTMGLNATSFAGETRALAGLS